VTRKHPPHGPTPQAETRPGIPEAPTLRLAQEEVDLPQAPPEWALVAYAGAALGRVFPLPTGDILVGRAPESGITLLDEEVSRFHARLRVRDGQVQVEDLESTNGTRVNGNFVHGPLGLSAGDRLAVGGHVLKLVYLDPLERAFHETLVDLSTRDALTGLANRASILAEFHGRFGLSLRYDRPLSVVVCDLDHFKQVNDTHGRGAGDLVLRLFGERLTATLRAADVAGRIGGEKFLVVLPETDLGGAAPFAERLRKATSSVPIPLSTGGLTVTCSLGIAQRTPQDSEAGQLLARADAALCQAKTGGRNQVVAAP